MVSGGDGGVGRCVVVVGSVAGWWWKYVIATIAMLQC